MKRIAETLGVSRPHLATTLKHGPKAQKPRGPRPGDGALLERIICHAASRPSYGYRRITALLNRERPRERVNPKRTYRLMKRAKLLLPKYSSRVLRPHDGKVITLASDLRWCSDCFEIRAWNGDRVHVAFSLDCCDRQNIAWVAAARHLDGTDIRDLMAQSVETRFRTTRCPTPVEWLSDNGPQYTANETRAFGARCGFVVRNTPAYSPESNGMAEAFVKTFKRDYVYVADLWDADTILKLLPGWFDDYNEMHPHKGLNMMSPNQFRRSQTA